MTLLFGNPGIPIAARGKGTVEGIKTVRKLGLDAMELQFGHSINVSNELAKEVKTAATENQIKISAHGQYTVNLAALEKPKLQASINKMIEAAKIVHACGGWSITWHMAYYLGRPKEAVHELVKQHTKTIIKSLQNQNNTVWIRPETTGKETQWGDLKECVKLSQEVEQVLPCIDFAHLHARYNGINNTKQEWTNILAYVEKELGRHALDNMHIQVCGINYSEKGEKNHLNLGDSDLNWKTLLQVWKDFKLKGVVITESPNIEGDALLLQKYWKSLR